MLLEISEKRRLLYLLKEKERREKGRKLFTYFPNDGLLRRELYQQHLSFFRLGKDYRTRGFLAGNRVGKTEGGGGYESALHLTGRYPVWWEGHRFGKAIDCWAAGDTKETVRDIIQAKMIGPEDAIGTGLIPREDIVQVQKRPNGNGAVDFVLIKAYHDTGIHAKTPMSRLGFKSYDQGRESFQGTEKDLIWLDEESNEGIRSECIIRLMTRSGLLIETFTPLRGRTPIVLKYLGDESVSDDRVKRGDDRALVMAGWDDVPHLSAEQKARMLSETEPHLREARSKGVPSIGLGAIYPVPEDEITVEDFDIPRHWPKVYGLDVGWNCTAAVFFAIDRDGDVAYIYSVHKQGQQEPSTHVAAINARGKMRGVIDPASRGRSQKDGEQLLDAYIQLGLTLVPADNSRESGLYEVHQRLATGRLKVFKSCKALLAEYRTYHRDEKGNIVKKDDHLMDAKRYGVVSGLDIATAHNDGKLTDDAAAYRAKRGYS